MQKFDIFLTMVVGLVSGAAMLMLSSQESYAQQNTTQTNFTKFFNETKTFQNCLGLTSGSPPLCVPSISVYFEDPSTIVLESDKVDLIWKAVAEVKKSGYKIDGFTSYPITAYEGRTNVHVLVVMSK